MAIGACGGPSPEGGGSADGGIDGSVSVCAADDDCGDQDAFCVRWRCRPGDPGTDARGCVDLGPPCGEGEGCDEDADRCGALAWCSEGREGCISPGDCDGDGHAHTLECGGDDCDDSDPDSYPGNPEICDPSGHDEDCNPASFGSASDSDLDGDGHVAASCCNGEACGQDCHDADVNINPSASELCDGVDNDCDGAADEAGATALCPGGACAAGRCSFRAWARTWGGPYDEELDNVTADDRGNVYVLGTFAGPVDFFGEERATPYMFADWSYLLAFDADGVFKWVKTPPGETVAFTDIAAGADGQLHVAAAIRGTHDFGLGPLDPGTEGRGVLLVLNADGTPQRQQLIGGNIEKIAPVASGGVVVTGFFQGTASFGGPDRTAPPGERYAFVARYGADGGYLWDTPIEGLGVMIRGIDVGSTRVSVLGGLATSTVEETRYVVIDGSRREAPETGSSHPLLISFDLETGATSWGNVYPQPVGRVTMRSVVVDEQDRTTIVGSFTDEATLGGAHFAWEQPPGATFPPGTVGLLVALDTSGALVWTKTLQSSSDSSAGHTQVFDVGEDPSGRLLVIGTFENTLNFGGGTRMASGGHDAFVARYDASDGAFVAADVLVVDPGIVEIVAAGIGGGGSVVYGGNFPYQVSFGSAPYVSEGGMDNFVYRLPQ